MWSKNNLACKCTWYALLNMKELETAFAASGDVKIDQLAFYNKLASSDARAVAAGALASWLDSVFVKYDKANYESGHTPGSAHLGISQILQNGDKTLADLAETVDAIYAFLGEG